MAPDALARWQELTPLARVLTLSVAWYGEPRPGSRTPSWCELDHALLQIQDFSLRQSYAWTNVDVLTEQVRLLRAWLLAIVMPCRTRRGWMWGGSST